MLGCFWSDPFDTFRLQEHVFKAWMSSNFSQIGLLTIELSALERLKD